MLLLKISKIDSSICRLKSNFLCYSSSKIYVKCILNIYKVILSFTNKYCIAFIALPRRNCNCDGNVVINNASYSSTLHLKKRGSLNEKVDDLKKYYTQQRAIQIEKLGFHKFPRVCIRCTSIVSKFDRAA